MDLSSQPSSQRDTTTQNKSPSDKPLCGIGLLLVLAALMMAGCSNLSLSTMPQLVPSRPTRPLALTLSPDAFPPVTLGPARGKTARTNPVVTTQTIAAASGGSVVLSGTIPFGGSFDYRLDFPPGALSQDTVISINVPNDNEAVVELLPHGLQFNRPVTFRIRVDVTPNPDLSGIDQATLDTYWYNNILAVWQGQSAQVQQEGSVITATVGLGHFSRYALGGDKEKKDQGRGRGRRH